MFRAVTCIVALTLFPALASAQQPCTTDARHVVDELYRHMLERQAGDASRHWVQQLEQGRMTVRDVVHEIATSEEHLNRFFHTEPGEQSPYYRSVGRFYRHILGRQPDEAGNRAFAELARQSGPEAVVNRILSSREYEQQFGDWGVPGSGGVRFCAPARWSGTVSSQTWSRSEAGDQRFEDLDRNNDGIVSRAEWRASREEFQTHDRNNDGILSGDELYGTAGTYGPAATSGELVVVDANQQWVDTGLTVRAGQTLTFDVSGRVQLSTDRDDMAQAAGALSGRRAPNAPMPNEPAGALIGRIGSGSPFGIGNQRSIQAPASGRLYLGVNDDHFADNSGQFRVIVGQR